MSNFSNLSRRGFLKIGGACAGLAVTAGMPELSYATVPGNKIFVFVMQNGGPDALDYVCPFNDSIYRNERPVLRRSAPGIDASSVLDINHGYYGLSPNLGSMRNLYMSGKVGFFHSVAFSDSQVHGGSHFAATNDMVRGAPNDSAVRTGWVNRLMQVLGGATGMSMAESNRSMPFLDGSGNVLTYQAPGPATDVGLVNMMRELYSPLSGLSDLLQQGYSQDMVLSSSLAGHENLTNAPRINDMCNALRERMALAAYMAIAGVANCFVLRGDGNDTHNGAVVAQWARAYADGMAAFHAIMEGAGRSNDYLVVTGGEFGRTVNESDNGTQHGDGGLMTVMSGNSTLMAGIGGQVLPGQLNLNQRSINNSMRPTVYAYDIIRGLLRAFYGLTNAEAMQVFPNRIISNVGGNA
ncbi:MAG: DUF1501 domain-containing protein [Alphaproteobacteria bacterium]|nr:MAG: DUF1501 domain-containing protein [Alphaproteobacteria bacterium]